MAAQKGNNYASEWTLENALPRFQEALEYAKTDECLCVQDAVLKSLIPGRTFYYLADNHEVLQDIKTQINDLIIVRVNKMALDRYNPCPASPAIWRMKQLGERDEQHLVQSGSMKQEITVTDKQTASEIEKMKERFDKE